MEKMRGIMAIKATVLPLGATKRGGGGGGASTRS